MDNEGDLEGKWLKAGACPTPGKGRNSRLQNVEDRTDPDWYETCFPLLEPLFWAHHAIVGLPYIGWRRSVC
jgi:hypothetical protein